MQVDDKYIRTGAIDEDVSTTLKSYFDGGQLAMSEAVEKLPSLTGDDAQAALKYGEIPPSGSPINEELLRTLGTEFLWPSSPDPDEFARAMRYLLPRIPADEMEEAAGVPVRNRT